MFTVSNLMSDTVSMIHKVFLFINSKCKHYFHNKLKPSKLAWTTMYRKQHKKVLN